LKYKSEWAPVHGEPQCRREDNLLRQGEFREVIWAESRWAVENSLETALPLHD
jgi:hypothetical protein